MALQHVLLFAEKGSWRLNYRTFLLLLLRKSPYHSMIRIDDYINMCIDSYVAVCVMFVGSTAVLKSTPFLKICTCTIVF